jgi:hypothetical protein
VHVAGQPVRVKRGPWGAKAEHDDVVAAADATGRSPREIADRARLLSERGAATDEAPTSAGDDLDRG